MLRKTFIQYRIRGILWPLKEDEIMGLRICTWNVNGYRAVNNKGFREWLDREQPDILCLQEIKVKPEQLSELQLNIPGYSILWNPAQRPGYSGVATFYKTPPEAFELGIGQEHFDIEGRVIRTKQNGFTLFNVYFPNGQRGKDRVDYKLNFYRDLLAIYDDLVASGEQVIITGDFNTAHTEIDLAHPKENQETSGFLPEERAMVDVYLEHGMIDIFRKIYPDKKQYTWWTYIFQARSRNVGWRIDYYLISPGLVDLVTDVVIHDDVPGSDHCPVSLYLR
jgi:exodeoxyribonuclease III